ncbi:hypothetical protein [Streptomyces poriticola]|uniref:hypothetical protein n=1 Tax=Streptomyces poriticola TaxID=3120506 RepID=UPI002FCE63AA
MAKTGYGKRSAGDENLHADADFAHLSPRDREIAVFIDHLDDGHAMGYKALAAVHPRYGQQAVRTSLRGLDAAGHVRHIREHITVEDNSMRWVTRTYWSRTPRSAEWWREFARARKGRIVTEDHAAGLARTDEPQSQPQPQSQSPAEEPTPHPEPYPEPEPHPHPESQPYPEPEPHPHPESQPEPEQSAAYLTLADLREADPRMPLSESDCRSLESLAREWLSRGSTPNEITRALTEGLPSAVNNPGGLARNRLETKMPPKKAKIRQKPARRRARVTAAVMCCITCDADERTTKLEDGMCPDCRAEYEADLAAEAAGELDAGYVPDTFLADPEPVYEFVDVARRAAEVRAAGGLRSKAERAL